MEHAQSLITLCITPFPRPIHRTFRLPRFPVFTFPYYTRNPRLFVKLNVIRRRGHLEKLIPLQRALKAEKQGRPLAWRR